MKIPHIALHHTLKKFNVTHLNQSLDNLLNYYMKMLN